MERLGGFCRAVLARPLQQGCLQCAHGINMPRTRRGCTDVIGRFDATASMACSGPASEGGTAVFIKGDGNHGRAVTDVVQGMGETAHHLSFLCRVIPRLCYPRVDIGKRSVLSFPVLAMTLPPLPPIQSALIAPRILSLILSSYKLLLYTSHSQDNQISRN